MSDVHRLTGTPWHVEYMTREEGDSRRHRAYCVHYQSATKYCSYRFGKCIGSAHCSNYKENPRPEAALITSIKPNLPSVASEITIPLSKTKIIDLPKPQNTKPSKAPLIDSPIFDSAVSPPIQDISYSPTYGLRRVTLSKIDLPDDFYNYRPDLQSLSAALSYYLENDRMFAPIVVSRKGNRYFLEDKYEYYLLALYLNLHHVTVRLGSKDDNSLYDTLRKPGQRVNHTIWGDGIVNNVTMGRVTFNFNDCYVNYAICDLIISNLSAHSLNRLTLLE